MPDGWRIPTSTDFVENSGWDFFSKNGNVFPFYASGDFNGDEAQDYAWLLIKSDNSTWELFAFLSKDNAFTKIDIGGKRESYNSPKNLYTGPITETEILTLRKGEKICKYDDNFKLVSSITMKQDGILFGVNEGDRFVLYFDSTTKAFSIYHNCLD